MAVEITGTERIQTGAPKELFQSTVLNRASFFSLYGVAADGQRFLFAMPATQTDGQAMTSSVTVVLNWEAGLTKESFDVSNEVDLHWRPNDQLTTSNFILRTRTSLRTGSFILSFLLIQAALKSCHWMSLASGDQLGPYEIVSPLGAGGSQALWRKDAKELFYLSLDGKLMAVDVKSTDQTIETGVPRVLFQRAISPDPQREQYCNTGDGQRFLFLEDLQTEKEAFTVVLNWKAALTPE